MSIKSDIEIAQEHIPQRITEIAAAAGIDEKYLEMYGNYKAKIDYKLLNETTAPDGKLILVTAITPTPAGEGKTTTSVGLADGLRKIGKKSAVALREPSLGPVFGVKGGAAGGGYAQGVPMEAETRDRLPPVSRPQARPGRRVLISSPGGFWMSRHAPISSAEQRLCQVKSSCSRPRVQLAIGPWKVTSPHRWAMARCRLVTSLNPISGFGWAAMHG